MMQVDQRRHSHARRADLHSGAGDRIKHPCRHHGNDAGRRFDVNEMTGEALFAVMPPDATPRERVPTVVNDDLLPDMGRMTGRLRWGERTGFSAGPTGAVSGRRPCTR
jgi:hypothetical protein